LGIILSSTIFFILLTSLSLADFLGKVVSVLDGETIEVLNNHHPERIRLSGIDCPEKGQAYGQRAKQATPALAFGKNSPSRPMVTTSTSAPLET
jgi:endonuclease YncB( thermonuclease family)